MFLTTQVLVKESLTLQGIARLLGTYRLSSTIFPLGSFLVQQIRDARYSKVGKIRCIHKVPFCENPKKPLHIGVRGRHFLRIGIFFGCNLLEKYQLQLKKAKKLKKGLLQFGLTEDFGKLLFCACA